ncbi:MAG TPA: hypothetical protein VNU49_05190 [Opitutaceae bacterium]|jgi:hypothetical protein|nr:hypothetical protein [Opitutaceae bacterium]
MIATYHPTPVAQGAFRKISPPSFYFGVAGPPSGLVRHSFSEGESPTAKVKNVSLQKPDQKRLSDNAQKFGREFHL